MTLTTETAASIREVFDHWKNIDIPISIEGMDLSVHTDYFSTLMKVFREEVISHSNGQRVTNEPESATNSSLLLEGHVGRDLRGNGVHGFRVSGISQVPEILKSSLDEFMDAIIKIAATKYLAGVGESIANSRPSNLHLNGVSVQSTYHENGGNSEVSVLDFEEDVLRQVRRMQGLKGLRKIKSEIFSEVGESLFVDTSGSEILQKHSLQILSFALIGDDQKDKEISLAKALYFAGRETYELRKLEKEVDKLICNFEGKRNAVDIRSGSYPVLMSGSAVGTFMHEALAAHLLSGKYVTDGDSRVFSTNRLGELILPDFLTITDDPTLDRGIASYKYDEEGVEARRTVLVENGVLRNYLLDKSSAARLSQVSNDEIYSNGRSRSQNIIGDIDDALEPEPRVTNLLVESSNLLSERELEERLLKEIRDSPSTDYGLIIGGGGGEVSIDNGQFSLCPEVVWRVDSEGRKEMVKGLTLVGDPDAVFHQILATGEPYSNNYGMCGASSGAVSTQGRAPGFLIERATAVSAKEDTSTPRLLKRLRN